MVHSQRRRSSSSSFGKKSPTWLDAVDDAVALRFRASFQAWQASVFSKKSKQEEESRATHNLGCFLFLEGAAQCVCDPLSLSLSVPPEKMARKKQQEDVDVGEGPSEAPVDKNKRFRKEKRESSSSLGLFMDIDFFLQHGTLMRSITGTSSS